MRSGNLPSLLRFGIFEVDPLAGELRKEGIKIKLQDQPFRVLLMLLDRPDELVTREQIQQKLWPGNTFVDFERGMNRAINKLREALLDDAASPRFIETLPRRGYRFLVPVMRETAHIPDLVPFHAVPPAKLIRLSALVKDSTGKLLAGALGLVALIAAGIFNRVLPIVTREPIRSVAVLPLENLSRNAAEDYFADGLTDALITDIAKIRSLRVISRTSIIRYKGPLKSLHQIAKELNVDAVVEGTVVHSAQRVRVTAQLIRTRDDRHLWSETYERDSGDIVRIQDEVAEAIADQIRGKLATHGQAGARRVNPQAYEAYLQGSHFGNMVRSADLTKSIELLQQAIQLDPLYAEAYAGLSHSYYVLGMLGFWPAADAYSQARAAAIKALQLNDTIAEAHNTLAEVEKGYEWDWQGAEAEYKRTFELNPSYSTAHAGYADYLTKMGRYDEGIAEANRARDLDPISASSLTSLGRILYRARRYDKAIAACKKARELDPNYANSLWWMALSYEQNHDFIEAVATARTAVNLSDSPTYKAVLAHACARAGDRTSATRTLDELKTLSKQRYVSPVDLATVYAGLGDRDAAFEWLEHAYRERTMRVQELPDPMFDSLHIDPRYRDLMRRLGLPFHGRI